MNTKHSNAMFTYPLVSRSFQTQIKTIHFLLFDAASSPQYHFRATDVNIVVYTISFPLLLPFPLFFVLFYFHLLYFNFFYLLVFVYIASLHLKIALQFVIAPDTGDFVYLFVLVFFISPTTISRTY